VKVWRAAVALRDALKEVSREVMDEGNVPGFMSERVRGGKFVLLIGEGSVGRKLLGAVKRNVGAKLLLKSLSPAAIKGDYNNKDSMEEIKENGQMMVDNRERMMNINRRKMNEEDLIDAECLSVSTAASSASPSPSRSTEVLNSSISSNLASSAVAINKKKNNKNKNNARLLALRSLDVALLLTEKTLTVTSHVLIPEAAKVWKVAQMRINNVYTNVNDKNDKRESRKNRGIELAVKGMLPVVRRAKERGRGWRTLDQTVRSDSRRTRNER
jgi:hypothetical protein